MNFLIYLIVGGIAGWLASIMMKRDGCNRGRVAASLYTVC